VLVLWNRLPLREGDERVRRVLPILGVERGRACCQVTVLLVIEHPWLISQRMPSTSPPMTVFDEKTPFCV
jgi:hypothetical protein